MIKFISCTTYSHTFSISGEWDEVGETCKGCRKKKCELRYRDLVLILPSSEYDKFNRRRWPKFFGSIHHIVVSEEVRSWIIANEIQGLSFHLISFRREYGERLDAPVYYVLEPTHHLEIQVPLSEFKVCEVCELASHMAFGHVKTPLFAKEGSWNGKDNFVKAAGVFPDLPLVDEATANLFRKKWSINDFSFGGITVNIEEKESL